MRFEQPVDFQTVLRTVATARLVLPTSIIRLAAGRHLFTESEQAFAFLAGANAIFTGYKMLTTPTSGWDDDKAMLARWGLRGMGSFEEKRMSKHAQATGQKELGPDDMMLIQEQEGMGLKPDVAGVAALK
jgi:biotin synthase